MAEKLTKQQVEEMFGVSPEGIFKTQWNRRITPLRRRLSSLEIGEFLLVTDEDRQRWGYTLKTGLSGIISAMANTKLNPYSSLAGRKFRVKKTPKGTLIERIV